MFTKYAFGPLLALLLVGSALQDDADKIDLKQLQGKWTLAALEVNGKDVPVQRLDGTKLTIKGNDYTIELKNKTVIVCKLKLDPSTDPKHLDMTFLEGENKDKVHKAIYRIDGDKFQLCRGLTPDKERPNQFATWPDTNYFLATWKRVDK
jgi:uncharacterized protein (TIGR03067 family)